MKKLLIPLNLRFFNEPANVANTGATGTGATNTGATNTGATNTGATNTGAAQQQTGAANATQPPQNDTGTQQTGSAGQQVGAGDATQQATNTQSQNTDTQKTFTQSELDFIVGERLKRVKQDAPSADDMKAFKAWQESQKTEAQKQAEALTAAQQAAAAAQAQLLSMQQMEAVRKLGIDESFIGYVHYEATNRSALKNITFDEALVGFVTESADKYKSTGTRQVTVDTDTHSKPQAPPPMALNFTGVRPRPGQ